MKKIILSVMVSVAIITGAFAQNNWVVDASHSNVSFSIVHLMVSDVDGSFKVFDGEVKAKDDSFQDALINFSVDVKSVNTENEDRDNHLRGDDFFSSDKYPKMTFKSTSFKKVSGNKYKLTGNLTIREVTKSVTFDVTFGGVAKDPWGNTKAGFKGSSTIKRTDFNLSWNKNLDAGGLLLSDEVKITVNVELNKK